MFRKVILIFIFILLFCKNAEAQDYLNVHYIELDENYNEYWVSEKIYFENIPLDNQIIFVYTYLFENGNFFPPGVRVLDAGIIGESLVLDVSGDVLYYYGAYMERRLKAQIIKTALDIPGINNITLLIDGMEQPLLEGSIIKEESECPDIFDSNILLLK